MLWVCCWALQDAKCKWVFTTDEGRRGGKTLHLKRIVDQAVEGADCVEKVLMFKITGSEVSVPRASGSGGEHHRAGSRQGRV